MLEEGKAKPLCVSPELRSHPVASTCQKVSDLCQSKSQTTADALGDGLKWATRPIFAPFSQGLLKILNRAQV